MSTKPSDQLYSLLQLKSVRPAYKWQWIMCHVHLLPSHYSQPFDGKQICCCRIRHLEGMQRRSGGRGRSPSPASASARHSTPHAADPLGHDPAGSPSPGAPQPSRRAHSGGLAPEGVLAPVTETAEQESSSSPGAASRDCSSSHSSLQDHPNRVASPAPGPASPDRTPQNTPASPLQDHTTRAASPAPGPAPPDRTPQNAPAKTLRDQPTQEASPAHSAAPPIATLSAVQVTAPSSLPHASGMGCSPAPNAVPALIAPRDTDASILQNTAAMGASPATGAASPGRTPGPVPTAIPAPDNAPPRRNPQQPSAHGFPGPIGNAQTPHPDAVHATSMSIISGAQAGPGPILGMSHAAVTSSVPGSAGLDATQAAGPMAQPSSTTHSSQQDRRSASEPTSAAASRLPATGPSATIPQVQQPLGRPSSEATAAAASAGTAAPAVPSTQSQASTSGMGAASAAAAGEQATATTAAEPPSGEPHMHRNAMGPACAHASGMVDSGRSAPNLHDID